MGMHFGIVCAELPKDELLARMRRVAGEMIDQGPVSDPNDFDPDPQDGSPVIAGERGGKSYLMDRSLLISGVQPDLIVALASAEPAALVVGCGAETVSGTYWLIAARGSEVIRSYFHSHGDLTKPFERGTPLSTEARQPLDGDLDGDGLIAALQSLGFDYESWFAQGPWQAFLYTGEGADDAASKGPLEKAQAEHHAQFQLRTDHQPTIKVVTRDSGGRVRDVADTGVKLADVGRRRQSGFSRFIKRLTGR